MPTESEIIEIRVQAALNAYSNMDPPNAALAARLHGAPPDRVYRRLKGIQSKMERKGSNRKLSDHQEAMVLAYINCMDRIGTAPLLHQVHNAAQHILKLHAPEGTEPPTLGRDWTKNFVKRHKDTTHKVQTKPMEIDRAAAHDPVDIQEWYTQYKAIKEKYGIVPCDEYNFDESGFRIRMGGKQWVITRVSDTTRLYLANKTNRDWASVLEAISGDGIVLPPAVIIKGARIMHQHLNHTDIPGNYMLGSQAAGYSNNDLAFEWIQHFDKCCAVRQQGVHRLLLLNGHGSHLTIEFAEYCEQRNIHLFAIPAHTSHFLQPLNIVLFQPFKHHHRQAVEMAVRTGCINFNIIEFLHALHGMRMATFKQLSITSGWEKTGLIPYNPELVLTKLRRQTAVTHLPTPPPLPQPRQPPCTPDTPRSLKKCIDGVYHYIRDMP